MDLQPNTRTHNSYNTNPHTGSHKPPTHTTIDSKPTHKSTQSNPHKGSYKSTLPQTHHSKPLERAVERKRKREKSGKRERAVRNQERERATAEVGGDIGGEWWQTELELKLLVLAMVALELR